MILTVLGVCAALYLGVATLMYAVQDELLFFPDIPTRVVADTPQNIGLAFEELQIATSDRERLHAWFVPADGARLTLIHFHGNAGNIGHRLDLLRIFHELQLNVVMFDYRGYGRSTGAPSEPGTYRDAEAVWRYVTEARGIAADRIVLHGQSLGGAIAAQLATRVKPAALIVESSFTSVPEFAGEIYRWLPARQLARLKYDTRAAMQKVTCPVLIIHSRDDEIIPFHHGQRLLEAARESKAFLAIAGDHNNGFLLSEESYRGGIESFLASLASLSKTALP